MKTIYPEETLRLLAECDDLLNRIAEDYQRLYPEPPAREREILGEERYAEHYHVALSQRRRAMLEDPMYQAVLNQKVKIISLSPCTYQFDANELLTGGGGS